ncbi:MAG: DUF192 domain-containing protein, partial [Candidatus Liptonbacteria bacterium]
MKRMGLPIIATIALVVIALAYVWGHEQSTALKEKTITVSGNVFTVEIRDTVLGRSQGLSGKDLLLDGRGMLFIFDRPSIYGFWMKDMRFAI